MSQGRVGRYNALRVGRACKNDKMAQESSILSVENCFSRSSDLTLETIPTEKWLPSGVLILYATLSIVENEIWAASKQPIEKTALILSR
jgi:hypothetical protein